MNYEEAMQYIQEVSTSGIMPGLSRMNILLQYLKHPEEKLNIIHVAGTNGKGSVCTYIASVLICAGYKVGRYISPTLYNYRERFQINQAWISEDDLVQLIMKVKEANDLMIKNGYESASAFELETAVSYLYFLEQQCDFVVLEVGMGGRLDATNTIKTPLLTVITSISIDHTKFLGHDIESIAFEKGGIIKAGIPVVIDGNNKAALNVLTQISYEKKAKTYILNQDEIEFKRIDINKGQIFHYSIYKNLETRMLGAYQLNNASLAILSIEVLLGTDIKLVHPVSVPIKQAITTDIIKIGIREAIWPGRFQCLKNNPLLIVDGAHNPAGAKGLRESYQRLFGSRKCVLMMGVFADKDVKHMLEEVQELSDTIIVYCPEHERGLDAQLLKKKAEHYFKNIIVAETQKEAVKTAESLAVNHTIIVAFGSLSTIASLCDIIKQ